MKKLGLCILPLLVLNGCNKSSNNTDSPKYSHIYRYDNVIYTFDNQMRCDVIWKEFVDGQGYTGIVKQWLVYLTGFYFEDGDYQYNTFYVCVSTYETNYYLYVIG